MARVEEFIACDESISYQIDRYTADSDKECMCITGLTFYFGWNDDPRAMRNFAASCFVELVSDASMLSRLGPPHCLQVYEACCLRMNCFYEC